MMDRLALCWEWLGEKLHERPVQFVFTVIALVLATIVITVSLVRSTDNTKDINEINSVLCNDMSSKSEEDRIKDCQELFDNLLEHPTPAQVQRLKELTH